jgi:cytochrome c-type biogenesis protein CcmH
MAKQAGPNDTVYIFARAASGPRMPLAIVRKQVKDLPATVVLDDSTAMDPAMKLSSMPEVVVVARVSKSGDAIAKAGDLEGTSEPVKTGAGAVAVSIANAVTAR